VVVGQDARHSKVGHRICRRKASEGRQRWRWRAHHRGASSEPDLQPLAEQLERRDQHLFFQ